MKKRKLIGIVTAICLILMIFAGCQSKETGPTETAAAEDDGIYDFTKYESSDVFDIRKVELQGINDLLCTTYQFTYLSDGLRIKGYISIPDSAIKSQKKSKCVLYNRGGNRDYGKLEDDTTASVCSVCDRVVIASQYRGADGTDGVDEFGGDDLHDVIKLIDLCEKQFTFVDMDDFCAIGASRGGVMTYMAARQDKRIKRVIGISAVSDLFQSYEARDDMKDVLVECIGSTPQEDPDAYTKRSAVCWADEINVPVLLIHSKQDKQVPYQQAETLYKKLKSHTDCTLITHDDDVHGMHDEDAVTIYDWLKRTTSRRTG